MASLEGFWYSEQQPWLPMPQPYVGPWHDRELFLEQLKFVEERCPSIGYRGWSTCRICGKHNGSEEYKTDDWKWPAGFRHYVEDHNVRPSTHFEKAILGTKYADMNRYKEWYRANVVAPRLAKVRAEAEAEPLSEDDLKLVREFNINRR